MAYLIFFSFVEDATIGLDVGLAAPGTTDLAVVDKKAIFNCFRGQANGLRRLDLGSLAAGLVERGILLKSEVFKFAERLLLLEDLGGPGTCIRIVHTTGLCPIPSNTSILLLDVDFFLITSTNVEIG